MVNLIAFRKFESILYDMDMHRLYLTQYIFTEFSHIVLTPGDKTIFNSNLSKNKQQPQWMY